MLADPAASWPPGSQQTSGMVMAKGVEDTTFYRCNRFVALNEVGGDPDRFGVSPAEFHDRAAGREAAWPRTMTTLSTHDTKRSEDVRARLAVLAEIPASGRRGSGAGSAATRCPDRSLELLAWQNLVGAWPISGRAAGGLPGQGVEGGQARHQPRRRRTPRSTPRSRRGRSRCSATPRPSPRSRSSSRGSTRRAAANSLGQKLLQLAGPGVPDVYQGTELFEYSLVDPDNRRPVDFGAAPRSCSQRIDGGWLPIAGVDADPDGAAKLLVTAQALRLRRQRPELFAGYRPVPADGPAAEHAVAFARSARRSSRWRPGCRSGSRARGGWGDTVAAAARRRRGLDDVLTGTRRRRRAPRARRRCWRATRWRCSARPACCTGTGGLALRG